MADGGEARASTWHVPRLGWPALVPVPAPGARAARSIERCSSPARPAGNKGCLQTRLAPDRSYSSPAPPPQVAAAMPDDTPHPPAGIVSLRNSRFLGVAGLAPTWPSTKVKKDGGWIQPCSARVRALAIIPASKMAMSGRILRHAISLAQYAISSGELT